MSANQFLSKTAQGQDELRTAIASSVGAGDANKIIQTDGSGRLDPSLMPVGIGADTEVMTTSENLSAGDFVNIWNNAGTRTARLADAQSGRAAHGFVLASSTSGQNATVYKAGSNTALTSLTPGAEYFLGTAGDATASPGIAAPAQLIQSLGYAAAATEIAFTFQSPTLIV